MINFKIWSINIRTAPIIILFLVFSPTILHGQKKNLYQRGWIDFNKNGRMDVYENPRARIDDRVADLLSQMTVNEKTNQLATLYGYRRVLTDSLPMLSWKDAIWKDGIANIDEMNNGIINGNRFYSNLLTFPHSNHAVSINSIQRWFVEETRLGIPVDFTNEGIHGLNHDRATPLPAPIGIGSTWNKELVFKAGGVVGKEAKALGYTNIYAPILDVPRDPRWGRVLECYGEDPFLIAELGKQMARGIQSGGVGVTLKHFAVYGIPKGGRDGFARTDPHVAPREMHSLHLYPFKKVIEEIHPVGVMCSYNDYDGVPIAASHYFLTELLREKFGFNGYVVSDSEAVEFVFTKHRVADSYKDAVRQVVEAGLNVRTHFTPPSDYILPLRELIAEGTLSQKTLDRRVSDVLRVKFLLGLFDEPYVGDPKVADQVVGQEIHDDIALKIQRQSLVLLKNDGNVLPLDRQKVRKVFVTGPLAAETNYAVSRYGPTSLKLTSVLDQLRHYLGSEKVTYAKGCNVVDEGWPESEIIQRPLTALETDGINEAVSLAKNSDVIIAVLGQDELRTGESKSRTSLDLPGRQQQLLEALHATGKPVVLVLINGQPLTINWANRFVPAILEAWFPGPLGSRAITEVLFGEYNPGGKLSMTFPKSTGQIELSFPFKPGSHAGQPGDGPNGYGKTAVNGPLYPFGFGLSYTSFSYSNLQLSRDSIKSKETLHVRVDITNTGSRVGDEVVQLYFTDLVSSVTTYQMQLRGFERITLSPGEKKTVEFIIQPEDLELLDKNMNWVVEPGMFEILIGASSVDIRLRKMFVVEQ